MTNEEKSSEAKQSKKRKSKSRGHGEGSVFYRRDRKKWVAQITLEDGGIKQSYHDKREEAADALQDLLYEQKQGILATGPKQTLGQYLEPWLENVQKPAIRINHYINTRTIINLHILPVLGRVQLRKLTAQQVQSLYAQKLGEGKSAKTIHNIHGVLHKALAQAVRWRLVARNICDDVELPRLTRYEYQTLTEEQAQRLLDGAKGHRFEVLLALALTTGMRHGELLGLRWQDVNLDKGTLQVRRSASRVRGQGYKEFEPKTPKGRRLLTLPQFILEMLKEHRTHQEEAQRVAGATWQNHGLVFCNKYGSYLRPDRVRKQFQKLLADAGLPYMRFHDLRHSAATILMAMGVPPKVVQEVLGHANISITLGIYSHVLPGMQDDAMGKWDDLLGGDE